MGTGKHVTIGHIALESIIHVAKIPPVNADVEAHDISNIIGGAALNLSAMLANIGLDVALLSAVGDDGDGRRLLGYIDDLGIDIGLMLLKQGIKTTAFTSVISDDGERQVYIQKGASYSLSSSDFDHALRTADTISVVGLSMQQYMDILCASVSIPNYVNVGTLISGGELNSSDLGILDSIDHAFMNECEARQLTGSENPDFRRFFRPNARLKDVIVTLGEKGYVCFTSDSTYRCEEIPSVKVVNTLGCGDAYMAGWIYADLLKKNPMQKMQAGHLCASYVVQSNSTRTEARLNGEIVA